MTVQGITTIGLIGAGNIGGALARAGVQHGYRVVISNSRGPETLADLVAELGEQATAATAAEAAAAGDVVVVTIPLKAIGSVPVEPLAGKVVIDTNNYYPSRDGQIPRLDANEATTAGLLQEHLPSSKVVKAFNHLGARQILGDGAAAGSPDRKALAVFGDDAEAKRLVESFIDELGFDAVDGGPLSESWRIERDQPGYGHIDAKAVLERNLAAATHDKN